MTIELASRMQALKPSPTLAMAAKARALRAQGVDVVSLAAGEPDFDTPTPICEAAIAALQAGKTKYTASSGTPELKAAIVRKLARENGIQADPKQIVVSCGAKHALYNAFMALLNPGDEVLLLAPYWATYADQVRLAGGVPVVVTAGPETGFVPPIDSVKAALTPRTRALVLNSPSNPAGAVLSRADLKNLAALALRHDLWIISDEIYERLTYGEPHQSVAALGQEVAERTVTILGCSKSFSMTGWRIGFSCAPEPVAAAMAMIQDQVTSNPTSFAQDGAIAALEMDPAVVEAMRVEFQARRDLMVEALATLDGVQVSTPKGAFYVFPDTSAFGIDDTDLAERLLTEAHVATVQGSAFGAPGYLRLSCAASREAIREGVSRIGAWLQRARA